MFRSALSIVSWAVWMARSDCECVSPIVPLVDGTHLVDVEIQSAIARKYASRSTR
jgi:hypothetical protein